RKALAPAVGEPAERTLRVVDDDDRQREGTGIVSVDHCCRGATRGRSSEKFMTIEALAAQGDEKLAAADVAAVGGHRSEPCFAAAQATVHQGGRFGRAHHCLLRMASAARATAWSENDSRLPRISW